MPSVLIDFSEEEYKKLKSKVNASAYKQNERFDIEEFIKRKSLE